MNTTVEIFIVNGEIMTLYDEVDTSFGLSNPFTGLFDNIKKLCPDFNRSVHSTVFDVIDRPELTNDDRMVLLSFVDSLYIEKEMLMDLVWMPYF